jgi:hypothetical protein
MCARNNAVHHDLQITQAYHDSLPARVREHLTFRLVDRLEHVVQHHKIEGLLEPDYLGPREDFLLSVKSFSSNS